MDLILPAPEASPTPTSTRSESFVIAPGAEVFGRLVERDKNLAIWSREPDLGVRLWLESQLASLPHVEQRLAFVDGRPDLGPLLQSLPDHRMRTRLRDDLEHLSRLLLLAMPQSPHAPRLKAAFGPVRDDQCRKFHVDWVELRLLTTYIGPGTEWLPDNAVNRDQVGASACCPADANRAIMRDPRQLRKARAGEVLLMKGEAYPGNHGAGVVHRSPPIEDPEQPGHASTPRVVFVLTALSRIEP